MNPIIKSTEVGGIASSYDSHLARQNPRGAGQRAGLRDRNLMISDLRTAEAIHINGSRLSGSNFTGTETETETGMNVCGSGPLTAGLRALRPTYRPYRPIVAASLGPRSSYAPAYSIKANSGAF
ncbi:hypothetical protein J7T55_015487 [Diaporthe amygdali]|uniref:uncharacterized protein n=1 Tax=Phomopsis amygdali TaxID=1214568 RepID=UPI0022FF19C6|nr:uncharacterized protein J7T55_015487 [Diaporthe amygdali]KAJ0120755.1 hypothetical protein J7T55_015487 [Diaporthe amygdali]